MIIPLIDAFASATIYSICVLSLLIALSSWALIFRNSGARISVVRAIVVSPNLVGSILDLPKIKEFLLCSIKSGNGFCSEQDAEAVLRFLLLGQAHRLTRAHVANESPTPNGDRFEVDFRLFQSSIFALHLLMEDRDLFNDAVDHLVNLVIQNNSADLKTGWFSKVTSINWLAMRLGGSNKSAVGYFVRFMFRDAILNLVDKISDLDCVFVGYPLTADVK